jgi:hypothetical protein
MRRIEIGLGLQIGIMITYDIEDRRRASVYQSIYLSTCFFTMYCPKPVPLFSLPSFSPFAFLAFYHPRRQR